jgi:hypothetical protein
METTEITTRMPKSEFTALNEARCCLRKSASLGNLTATTAEGTDSFSILGYCKNSVEEDEQKLTVFQLDSAWSAKGNIREAGNASISDDESMVVSMGLTTVQDETTSLPDGIPSEVMVIHYDCGQEQSTTTPGSSGASEEDVHHEPEMHKTLLKSYKEKLHASCSENDALHDFLKKTQGYAEELLNERKALLQVIEELENEINERNDQELLLKVIVVFSLGLYFCGGSAEFLVAAVGLQLFVTLVNHAL